MVVGAVGPSISASAPSKDRPTNMRPVLWGGQDTHRTGGPSMCIFDSAVCPRRISPCESCPVLKYSSGFSVPDDSVSRACTHLHVKQPVLTLVLPFRAIALFHRLTWFHEPNIPLGGRSRVMMCRRRKPSLEEISTSAGIPRPGYNISRKDLLLSLSCNKEPNLDPCAGAIQIVHSTVCPYLSTV